MDRDQDLDDELRFHLETEAEALIENGIHPADAHHQAHRDLGNLTQLKEQTRMNWTSPRWDQLLQDVRYGWRQLIKSKATSGAAILSLALALGSCMAAFRLIDALLLRPLPITDAANTFVVARHGIGPDGYLRISESCPYPLFVNMRAAIAPDAELVAVAYAERIDITYSGDADMEKAYHQDVSTWMFANFGLKPALGRLLTPADDGHPRAVLSYDYWTRRFGQDPQVLGRTLRLGTHLYEIVGVLAEGFAGTEPGTMIDLFTPITMRDPDTLANANAFWLRPFVRPKPGVSIAPLLQRLNSVYLAHEAERAKLFAGLPKSFLQQEKNALMLDPASSGVSIMQQSNRRGLLALGVLVALVLLIACANVGNLMLARAMSRTREMALRVSIGASRARLVRLVLVESGWIALLAALLGAAFAWWAAPFVVSLINPANNPARLQLPADYRVFAFGAALALSVTLIFGLIPALRASGFRPASALKGGENPHSRRRLMHALIATQVALCAIVLFIGGLFVSTYNHLAHQPTGFSSERLLTLETVSTKPQLPISWNQLSEHLQSVPGVEAVAISAWPIMNREMSNYFIAFNGGPPVETLTYFYKVAPTWRATMKLKLLSGRDLLPTDTFPQTVIVNETFARTYFNGENPVGRTFEIPQRKSPTRTRVTIVGLTADARYRDMRLPNPPMAFAPFASIDADGVVQPSGRATFNVRTIGENPLALAATLRREVTRFRSDFRVTNLRTQQEIVDMHTLRERLLALLALFFSIVALVLAAVGLYGVLDYSVLQRRREIGIRLAMGAPATHVIRGVTSRSLAMVLLGIAAGLTLGHLSQRYLETLIYGIQPNSWPMLALPAAILFAAALLAAVPPSIRAVRLDPIQTLRTE